ERAWQARSQFMPGGNIGGWLFRILCNRHRDNLRRRTGGQVPLPDEVPDAMPEPDEISALLALSPQTVIEALGQLPAEPTAARAVRARLELLGLGGKRYREIAEELNIPINTVGTRIRRARQMLQKIFAEQAKQQGGGR